MNTEEKMPYLKQVLPLILIGFVMAGCQAVTPSASEPQSPSQTDTQPSEAPSQEAAADVAIAEVVKAINQQDAVALASYMLREFGDSQVAFAEAAIADYQVYFNKTPITKFERIGTAPYNPEAIQYKLSNESGQSKDIYVSFQDEMPQVYDEFLNFSGQAKGTVEGVIAAIQAEDAQQLARVLTPDDIEYPVDQAEAVIATYRDRIDPETLTSEFQGLDPQAQQFMYQISGSKDGELVEHSVRVIYGDGLVGLQDEWIPPAS